jgi:Mn2+/Fe2+ NRAMP family transporter
VLVVTQFINGLLLPVLLVAVTRLASNRTLMGVRANGRVYNLIVWLTVFVVSALSLLYVGSLIFARVT